MADIAIITAIIIKALEPNILFIIAATTISSGDIFIKSKGIVAR